jgi:hypothetical protein
MNKAKNSLQENLEEILANLPEEFHADIKKDIDGMSDGEEESLTGEDEVAAIKAELVANPDVDESAAAAELKDIKAPTPVSPASEAEIEEQKAQMLSEAKAQASK